MDIKDYQKLGGYQYAYETVTVIKKETIKPGEYFIIDFSKTSLRSNTLNAIKFDAKKMKLLIETIDLGKEWRSAFKSNLNDIPILFKYLGENKAIEPLTGEIFIIAFQSEQKNLIHKEYKRDDFDYLFENQEYYNEYKNFPLIISGEDIYFQRPKNDSKIKYYQVAKKLNLKQLIQNLIQKYQLDFIKNYQEIVQTRFYDIANVDNIMYDFDRNLEENISLKKKLKK